MIMRPPQHGQRCECTRSSVLVDAGSLSTTGKRPGYSCWLRPSSGRILGACRLVAFWLEGRAGAGQRRQGSAPRL